jgi:transmembrane sensor
MQADNHVQKILNKFILNQCSKEETEEVIAYIKNIKGSGQLPSVEDVLELFDEKPVMTFVDANRIHDNILEIVKHQEKESKGKRSYFWKYAVAAVFTGVLTTTYLLRDNFYNTTQDSIPTIVNTNIILPGTDKATLTLEDGSVVTLEKGDNYQTQNANSNGEQIVYKPGKQNPSEIVYNYLTIPRGGQFFIKLSDDTQVWLNSESQLKYPVNFIEGESRNVELVYGEAYFDVSPSTEHKGAKFKVFNQSQEIEVLGTEFNLKAYKDEIYIYTTLVEGVVAVNFKNRKQNLTPNQQSTFDLSTKNFLVKEVDVYNEISWKDGVFSFQRKSLSEIMRVISRWYDMDVRFENTDMKNAGFNGVLRKNQKLEKILESIKSYGVIQDYEIINKTIFLK